MNMEDSSRTEELCKDLLRGVSYVEVVHKCKSASYILVSICAWHEECGLVERTADYAEHNTVV
jgi:hypothetical protein